MVGDDSCNNLLHAFHEVVATSITFAGATVTDAQKARMVATMYDLWPDRKAAIVALWFLIKYLGRPIGA